MTLRDRLLRLLWAGPVALAVCYFSLWACAPVFTQSPPTPIADDRNREAGLTVGTGLEFGADDPCSDGVILNRSCNGPQLQAYYRSRVGKVELAAVAHGGVISVIGGGLQIRGYFVESDRALFGLTGGVGWFWASLGIPVSGALSDNVWIYTEPTASFAVVGMVRVPVGVRWHMGQGFSTGLEGGAMTGVNNLSVFPYAGLNIGAAF